MPDTVDHEQTEPPRWTTASTGALSTEERGRYSRHVLLKEVGEEGQRRLKQSRVLIVGAGGLGSPCALYLAAAGIGTIGLIDHDVVDPSNLHRQLLHGTRDVGRPKLESARERLADVNPHVVVQTHEAWLTAENALELIRAYDVIVDGTDNFATRYLVNDACVLTGRPNVHGSVFQFDGQASVFATTDGPCYRCLYPEPPPPHLVQNCAEGGVLGVLPGLIGTIQAVETIKLVLGIGESLAGRLLMVDALGMEMHTIRIARDPQCPMCGTRTMTSLADYAAFCGTPLPGSSGTDAVDLVTPTHLREQLARGEAVQIVDVREPHETVDGTLDSARLIPLAQLPLRASELDPAQDTVVVCRSGQRSARAVLSLRELGFRRVRSLDGGMLAWERVR